jgi:regulator of nucleoside diphosphate kinase
MRHSHESRHIIVSSADRDRLLTLLNSAHLDSRIPTASLRALEAELSRAAIVAPEDFPHDAIGMDSTVWFRDLDSHEIESYTLVFPNRADVAQDRISILAPIGTALLGYRQRDVIEWPVPAGKRRLQIVRVEQATPALAMA